MSLKSIFINTMLMAVSVFVFLMGTELILRSLNFTEEKYRVQWTYDNTLGDLYDDVEQWIRSIDMSRETFVDSRGHQIPVKKSNKLRVLFLGDSGTWGSGVEQGQTFVRLIEKKIKKINNHDIEVINGGAVGFNTVNQYQLLKHYLLPLKPDLVILVPFLQNDINFNMIHFEKMKNNHLTSKIIENLKSHSALINFIYYRILSLGIDPHFRFSFEKWDIQDVPMVNDQLNLVSYEEGELALYLKEGSNEIQKAYKRTSDTFKKFINLSLSFGFKIKVILLPTPSTVTSSFLITSEMPNFGLEKYNLALEDLEFSKPVTKILEICTQLNLNCLDTTESLRKKGLSNFLPKDDHLSPQGHQLFSDLIIKNFVLPEMEK